jgi:hypothetical protein
MQSLKAGIEVHVDSAGPVLKESVAPFGIGVSKNAAQSHRQTPSGVAARELGDIENFCQERRLRTRSGHLRSGRKVTCRNRADDFEVGVVEKCTLLADAEESPNIDALIALDFSKLNDAGADDAGWVFNDKRLAGLIRSD